MRVSGCGWVSGAEEVNKKCAARRTVCECLRVNRDTFQILGEEKAVGHSGGS